MYFKYNVIFVLICSSTPIECLHTILLGPYKYMLRQVMENLSSVQKNEIISRFRSFPYSGFQQRLTSNVCRLVEFHMYTSCVCHFYRYVGSLVGRDFKTFAQLALPILQPYLNGSEFKAWFSLTKVLNNISK